jgi:nickel-type superoxide dismutase maturation protease
MRDSNGKEILLWLTRKRRRYRVKGDSMLPFLCNDDEVLVNLNAYRLQTPLIGDIVVAWHPTQPDLQIIKRVVEVDKDDRYYLRGDNSDPTQNSSFLVHFSLIQGRVTSRFSKPYDRQSESSTVSRFCKYYSSGLGS